MMERTLADRDRANRLFDVYGALLTAQQQQVVRRYYGDDLSLGEIAAQMGVSRQAVHDGLRRALAAMERFEGVLHLVSAGDNSPARADSDDGPGKTGGTEVQGGSGGDHYFATAPASTPRLRAVQATLRGRRWSLHTVRGVFATRGVDQGTEVLIDSMRIGERDRVLDLGCGYGVVGLVAAALAPRGLVWLVDVNTRAAAVAAENARANGIRNAAVAVGDAATAFSDASFDVVVTNPPIRAGRAVVAQFIDEAWRVLCSDGRFYLVARTAQGARTLARLIAERFGNVTQVALRGGYRVYEAVRVPSAAQSARVDEPHAAPTHRPEPITRAQDV
jgi:16S rRNA (guanine1207-N2)-methyltransferase